MSIVQEVNVAAGHAIAGIRAGEDKLASRQLAGAIEPTIEVSSVAFDAGSPLPISCSVDGVGAAPALRFGKAPEGVQSLLVICEDPDAPFLHPYVHWLVYGIPAAVESVDAQTQHDYRLGENSKSEKGFTPAAPPRGHGVHHYHFQVFALDTRLELEQGRERDELVEAAMGHVLAWGEIVGTYERE
ncbi:MAG: YbhB/YbcL family Raf kinase inhibitor-like protein [Polyangiaceae bacterium]